MSAQSTRAPRAAAELARRPGVPGGPVGEGAVNEVRLVGRVSGEPEERTMPSGDTARTFRVVVDRGPRQGRSRQSVDTVDCVVWSGRVKRASGTWRPGDVVEVTGALRRRFFRTATGSASRVEVEVSGGRVIRRAAT